MAYEKIKLKQKSNFITYEDLIEGLNHILNTQTINSSVYPITIDNDISFIRNVSEHTSSGKNLFSRQAYVVSRISKKYQSLFLEFFDDVTSEELTNAIENPCYRSPIVESKPRYKEVRLLDTNILVFKLPFTASFQKQITILKKKYESVPLYKPIYVKETTEGIPIHLWLIRVEAHVNFKEVFDLVEKFKFKYDQTVMDFFEKMLVLHDYGFIAATDDSGKVNLETSNSLISSMLEQMIR